MKLSPPRKDKAEPHYSDPLNYVERLKSSRCLTPLRSQQFCRQFHGVHRRGAHRPGMAHMQLSGFRPTPQHAFSPLGGDRVQTVNRPQNSPAIAALVSVSPTAIYRIDYPFSRFSAWSSCHKAFPNAVTTQPWWRR
jgi:hypothetical protein